MTFVGHPGGHITLTSEETLFNRSISIILSSKVNIGGPCDYFLVIDKCYDFPVINKYLKNRSHLVFQNFKKCFLYGLEFRYGEIQIKKQNQNSSKNEA